MSVTRLLHNRIMTPNKQEYLSSKRNFEHKREFDIRARSDRYNSKELQWLEHVRNHENLFETGVVHSNAC